MTASPPVLIGLELGAAIRKWREAEANVARARKRRNAAILAASSIMSARAIARSVGLSAPVVAEIIRKGDPSA